MVNLLLFFKIRKVKIYKYNSFKFIYCLKRKRYYILTNEEYIRQKILLYLIYIKKYDISNIYLENKIKIKNKVFKIDILIKNNNKPYIIIECKTYKNKIKYIDLDQIIKYGSIMKIKFYWLTNKFNNLIFYKKKNKIIFIKEIPTNFKI
ncbi:MAG: type I restriction enzyme HsdR N-terminal domain-containing protein [Candidatus Shikimatogenerans bostrichidophilus]|nr:MAG: type I restriction enzyme HsdR N-terminal domain-containing protein [Candidatus Shikimatogenerans bostrichidophilus]